MSANDPLRPGAFLAFLGEHIFRRHRPVERSEDIEIHYLDLTAMKLLAGSFVPFTVSSRLANRATIDAAELAPTLRTVAEIRRREHADFVVLVLDGRLRDTDRDWREGLGEQSIAILDRATIDAVQTAYQPPSAAHPNPRRAAVALTTHLVNFLGCQALSPYQPGQPASGERFFGRVDSLAEALPARRGPDITILGCRRIGKTSLLGEIRRRLLADGPEHVRVADVYASTYSTTTKVLEAITRQVIPKQSIAQRYIDDPNFEDKFPEIIRAIPERDNVDVAVLLDEVDELLELDARQSQRLMKTLRATFQRSDRCRIFFAGFRRVMMERLRPGSEMFNFTKPVALRGLRARETKEMVRGPLEALGIVISDLHLDAIYRETKGHPELIQMYCSQIVRVKEETGDVPSPDDMVREVMQSDMFREKVFNAFLASANPYEKLLCLQLIALWRESDQAIGDFEFDWQNAHAAMQALKVPCRDEDAKMLLRNLDMVSIVEPIGTGRYRFAVPALVEYVAVHPLQYQITTALHQIDKGAPLEALYGEGDEWREPLTPESAS